MHFLSPGPLPPEPVWINNNQLLEDYCQRWSRLDAIALDTEFIRTDTFYPQPGLIQVGTGTDIFLIDPLEIDQWQPLARLFQDSSVVKVLHACSEDLEVFKQLTDTVPRPLFDTQLAAAFANLGFSLGYQALLKHILNIDLPKDETRSNWHQRPLTEAQVRYASLDVAHLLEVYQYLDQLLTPSPKKAWLEDECLALTQNVLPFDPENAWQEVKRSWQLRPQQLAVLKALCHFREVASRRQDVPRNRIIPKGSLWSLARFQPKTINALRETPEMRSSIIRHHGEQILDIIRSSSQVPEAQRPEKLPPPLPKNARDQGKQIKTLLSQRAVELQLPIELLMPGKLTTPLLRSWLDNGQFILPDTLTGWRRDIIGTPLTQQLNQLHQQEKGH
ncbi:ribonuclease D [Endozoicomonas sp. SCSIO W0465]|uniref:ribonuclease D n=1 Tax=Endozoicomonas sp. SCSIO W0465 TaxID=2918516 RepID=UPI002075C6F6|nr:ribonuclease D [Endozoicomonas sp. SCSIO W0465]USE35666.1 ribonuclease D [Endozoicomonas sp. SCSIO W0465]